MHRHRCKIEELTNQLKKADDTCADLSRTNADLMREVGRLNDELVQTHAMFDELREQVSHEREVNEARTTGLEGRTNETTAVLAKVTVDMDLMSTLAKKYLVQICSLHAKLNQKQLEHEAENARLSEVPAPSPQPLPLLLPPSPQPSPPSSPPPPHQPSLVATARPLGAYSCKGAAEACG